jgi:peptidoglycan/LPS O-acetylase OafA/YrhL
LADKRFHFIDALRGIAALGVVLFHAVEGQHISQLPSYVQDLAEYGQLGVPIFFVISGFVIAQSLRDQRMTVPLIGSFIVRRSIRLDPPYWVAIVLTIGFSVLATKMVAGRPADQFTAAQIAAHLTYTQNILGFKNINTVFWTLCFEVQFYVVFAVLLLWSARWSLAAALAVSLLWCFRLGPSVGGWFPSLWYAFLLGASAWYGWIYSSWRPIYLAYFGAVLGSALWFNDMFAITCALTSAVIFALALCDQLSLLKNWRWLQFLGTISYSLYLVHNPITGATFRAGYRLTGETPTTEAFWFMASIAACVLVAFFLWLLVERPSHMLSKRLFGAQPFRSSAAAAASNPGS